MESLQFGPSLEHDGYFTGLPLSGPITSRFGAQDIQEHAEGHTGTDIGAPIGTPVLTPAPGLVSAANASDVFGTFVTVQHAAGFVSLYAHLSRLDVRPGQRVRPGDRLGLVGMTGLTTGPHLHWGLAQAGSPLLRGPHLRNALDYCQVAPRRIDEERLWRAVASGISGALQSAGAMLDTHTEADFAGFSADSPERAILEIQLAANAFLARWG